MHTAKSSRISVNQYTTKALFSADEEEDACRFLLRLLFVK